MPALLLTQLLGCVLSASALGKVKVPKLREREKAQQCRCASHRGRGSSFWQNGMSPDGHGRAGDSGQILPPERP